MVCPRCGHDFDPLWNVDRMTKEFIRQGMFNSDQEDSMRKDICQECSVAEKGVIVR